MTARADISNHRRKVLEERQRRELAAKSTAADSGLDRDLLRNHETAWEKGEAKPPFYREVLEEGVRRGDVVSREQVGRVVFDTTFDERQAVRKLCAELAAERQRALLAEAKLREAEGRIDQAIGVLDHRAGVHYIDVIRSALSILAGTEKEGDHERTGHP